MNAAFLSDPTQMSLTRTLRHVSAQQAAAALTARVVADLEQAIRERGRASLAVPGGTTPGPFLSLLGYRNLDWRRVTVTLTDERWVPPSQERSNAGLVNRTFARAASGFRWFGLWREGMESGAAPAILDAQSQALPWPLDVVVLGMGDDGHVASLFPGDESGFVPAGNSRFVAVSGPGGEPRISLRASALIAARSLHLLINGADKLALFDHLADSELPVARILTTRPRPAFVFAGP